MTEQRFDIAVIGAGLAGLAAAAAAAEAGRHVVVLDAHQPGGRARVDDRNGFRFNRGPRALYIGGPGEQVLQHFGVRTDTGGRPALDGIMLRRAGELHRQPVGVTSLLRTTLLSAREKAQAARLLGSLGRLDTDPLVGRTVREWIDDTARGTVADLVEMLVRITTYTNAPDELDAGAAAMNLKAGTAAGVRYLDGGFQSLVDGLASAATRLGAEVRAASAVRTIEPGGDGFRIDGTNGSIVVGSVVIAAGGPDAASQLLPERPAAWSDLGPEATVSCLELGLRRRPRHAGVFGVDEPLYLNTHCPPADLAPDGAVVVHAMRYQPTGDTMPADQQRRVLRDLASAAGIGDDDIVEERFLARMVVTGAIPTAAGGGLAGRAAAEVPGLPGAFVAGDWVGPVGMLADGTLASGAHAGRLAAARSVRIAA
jgi:phytoene dehydrogenase-like protein